MIGTVLNNRYRIDAMLGEGGMGVVYTLWQFDRAQILQALAPALVRRGQRGDLERARAAYAEVLAIFEKMEARRWAEPVKQELAKLES